MSSTAQVKGSKGTRRGCNIIITSNNSNVFVRRIKHTAIKKDLRVYNYVQTVVLSLRESGAIAAKYVTLTDCYSFILNNITKYKPSIFSIN